MRLIDIESESFLNEMREKQNACKDMIHNSDDETIAWTDRDHWEGIYSCFVEMALTLNKQPTVDAAPVVHGRWIHLDQEESTISGKCSCCGWEAHYYEDDVADMPYCPRCGAKMDLEEQNA